MRNEVGNLLFWRHPISWSRSQLIVKVEGSWNRAFQGGLRARQSWIPSRGPHLVNKKRGRRLFVWEVAQFFQVATHCLRGSLLELCSSRLSHNIGGRWSHNFAGRLRSTLPLILGKYQKVVDIVVKLKDYFSLGPFVRALRVAGLRWDNLFKIEVRNPVTTCFECFSLFYLEEVIAADDKLCKTITTTYSTTL